MTSRVNKVAMMCCRAVSRGGVTCWCHVFGVANCTLQAIAESPSVEYRDGFVRKRDDWREYLASEASFMDANSPPDKSECIFYFILLHFSNHTAYKTAVSNGL